MDDHPCCSKSIPKSSLVPAYDSDQSDSDHSFVAICSDHELEVFTEMEMSSFRVVPNPLAELLSKYRPKKPRQAEAKYVDLGMMRQGIENVLPLDEELIRLPAIQMPLRDLEKIVRLQRSLQQQRLREAHDDGDDELSEEDDKWNVEDRSKPKSGQKKKKNDKEKGENENSDDDVEACSLDQSHVNVGTWKKKVEKNEKKKRSEERKRRRRSSDEQENQGGDSDGEASKDTAKNKVQKKKRRRRSGTKSSTGSPEEEKKKVAKTSKKKKVSSDEDDEEEKKKTKKASQKSKKSSDVSNGDEDEEKPSSDDDCNQINKVMRDTPTFISVKDLKEKEPYKIVKFEVVETTNGRRVRLTLVHKQFGNREVFVHLPERVLGVVTKNLDSFNEKCRSKKPMFVVHMGLRGRAFILKFTRHPNKHM